MTRRDDTAYEEGTWSPPLAASSGAGEDVSSAESDDERRVREQVEEISDWWRQYSEEAIRRTAPKSVEYAGSDLDIMAVGMLAVLGSKVDGMPDVEKMRMGRYMAVQFYALGKVSRALGRLGHGVMPNADNEFDLMVYAVMAARIRETGEWT